MARENVSARLATVLVVAAGLTAAGAPAGWAQGGGERSGDRAQPPTELLEEYPFRQGRLRSTDGPNERARPAVSDSSSESDTLGTLAPVIIGAAILLALGGLGVRAAQGGSRGEGEAKATTPAPRPKPRPSLRLPSTRRPPTQSYAVVNQKGGVGKTTVSLTLGAAAARRGRRVLLVDLDPQASATSVVRADVRDGPTMSEVLLGGGCPLGEAVRPTCWGLDVVPADRRLRSAETTGTAALLPRRLSSAREYDLILIDCPPSLGTLTINALAATSRVVIVTEPSFLALHAMEELLDAVRDVTMERNPGLELAGVVLNRVETTAEHKRSVADLVETFGAKVLSPQVPKRAILQDAMRQGVPPQDMHWHSHYALEIAEIFEALAMRLEAIQVRS